MPADRPDRDEDARLQALRSAAILDTPPEQLFDDITALAAQICGMPISLMTLVDERRQWFKSRHNFGVTETPRDIAFCHHTIEGREVLIVEDASADPRFADNPLVTGDPEIRFYAGAPLVVGDGHRIGTVCVIDSEPRTLDASQIAALEALARHASNLLMLRSSERQLQSFLELSPESTLIVDRHGGVRYSNAAFERLVGRPSDDLVHSDLATVIGREAAERIAAELAEAQVGIPIRFDIAIPVGDDEVPVELSCGLVDKVGERLAKIVVHDRRRRLERDRELDRSRRLLRAIIDNSPTLVLVKDLEGRYLLVNEPYTRTVGLPAEEIIGRDDTELLGPDRGDFYAATDRRALDTGSYSFRDVAPDGRSFLSVKFPLLGEDGQPFAVCAIATDMTEQLRLEQQTRDLLQRLERQERLEGLGHLAGGVAHDFNNLLAVITSAAELAQSELGRDDDPDLAEIGRDVEDILAAAERAARLTRQLLVFARRQPAAPEPLDVNALISDMTDLVRRSLGPSIDVDLDLCAESCTVEVDRSQLEQVLLNLAINSRDAMATGGTLTIRTRRTAVAGDEVEGLAAGPVVVLEVIDTGAGMDRQTAGRAFEPFFSTKGPGRGTGLGLATVYGAVTKAGGAVAIDSSPGRGTTVSAFLPSVEDAADDAPGDAPGRQGGEGDATAPRTILMVDDQSLVRDILARLLERHGYRVLTAEGAEDAIARWEAEEGAVDLLLTDVVLAGRSGPALAGELRQRDPDLPVLLISGYPQEALASEGGDLPLLQKPFSEAELTARLTTLLRRGERSDEAGG